MKLRLRLWAARLPRRDPRERRHPHARPVAPDAARARDRRRPDRGRRRRARDRTRLPGVRRPRRPLRPARVHRLARPLPDVGARAARGEARRLRVARRGARPHPRAERLPGGAGSAATAGGAATGGDGRADAGGPRRDHRRHAGGDDREGLPLALAQLGRARARGRRPRRRGGVVERDATRRADRGPARGGRVALQGAVPERARRRVRRRDARRPEARGRPRRHRVHDKDGWLGARGSGSGSRSAGSLSLRVWQSVPHERLPRAARARAAQRRRLAASCASAT